MGWERHKSGRRYYTRSKRVRGKVKREYIPLSVAQHVAWIDAYERETRAIMARLQRLERQEREEWYGTLFEPLDALSATCDALVTAELSAAGYRLVGGRWRRPRHGKQHDEAEADDQEAQGSRGERRDDAGEGERTSDGENHLDG